jgi:hypothetical protein
MRQLLVPRSSAAKTGSGDGNGARELKQDTRQGKETVGRSGGMLPAQSRGPKENIPSHPAGSADFMIFPFPKNKIIC